MTHGQTTMLRSMLGTSCVKLGGASAAGGYVMYVGVMSMYRKYRHIASYTFRPS